MFTDTDSSTQEKSQEIKTLVERSDHFALFGTLTSLVSTGFLFIEQAFNQKLPKWVNNVALGTTGVGILGVVASFYYRLKASKIALYSSAHIGEDEHVRDEIGVSLPQDSPTQQMAPEVDDDTTAKRKWVQQAISSNEATSQAMQR